MLGWIGKITWSWTNDICVQQRSSFLQADWSKVRETLDWRPTVNFGDLVKIMVDADLKEVETKLSGGAAAVAVTSQH